MKKKYKTLLAEKKIKHIYLFLFKRQTNKQTSKKALTTCTRSLVRGTVLYIFFFVDEHLLLFSQILHAVHGSLLVRMAYVYQPLLGVTSGMTVVTIRMRGTAVSIEMSNLSNCLFCFGFFVFELFCQGKIAT